MIPSVRSRRRRRYRSSRRGHWATSELWKELGFGKLRCVFRCTCHTTDVEALIRVIVLNRLCDPDSKLGAPRWLETVAPPEVDAPTITHQQLLRPMIDQDLSEVFYDLTTIRTERLTSLTDDVLEFGMARKG